MQAVGLVPFLPCFGTLLVYKRHKDLLKVETLDYHPKCSSLPLGQVARQVSTIMTLFDDQPPQVQLLSLLW